MVFLQFNGKYYHQWHWLRTFEPSLSVLTSTDLQSVSSGIAGPSCLSIPIKSPKLPPVLLGAALSVTPKSEETNVFSHRNIFTY
jgi:hypothetical protein